MWATFIKLSSDDEYLAHQSVWSLFPSAQAEKTERPFCYQKHGGYALVFSNVKPDSESVEVIINDGADLLFDVIGSPSRGTYRDDKGRRRRMNPHTTVESMNDWLKRRLDGAALVTSVITKPLSPHAFSHPKSGRIVHPQAHFRGRLKVVDAGKMSEIVARGIGQAAAFGLGAVVLPELLNGLRGEQ
ncbi:MAG: type I-E CRISPR-associated protein Cas6/Cse3/CasE [Marinagarivorans sp.]|nr:type I-E CRISPR-associated protein Cas6/Cse3/CasE [Marinagarivorans sp.]